MKVLIAVSMLFISGGMFSSTQVTTITKKAKIKIKHCPPNSSPLCRTRPKFT
jgi:hypothetical protein